MEITERIARTLDPLTWQEFDRMATPNHGYHDHRHLVVAVSLAKANEVVESLGLEKWNDGPANSMERYMTRWFDRDGS